MNNNHFSARISRVFIEIKKGVRRMAEDKPSLQRKKQVKFA
jgi:hypothetical protein